MWGNKLILLAHFVNIVVVAIAERDVTKLPCKLEWTLKVSGETYPNAGSIVVLSKGFGIAKDSLHNVYPINLENDVLTTVNSKPLFVFEILTNPNKCVVEWLPLHRKEELVEENTLTLYKLFNENGTVTVVQNSEKEEKLVDGNNVLVLNSYQKGFTAKIVDFGEQTSTKALEPSDFSLEFVGFVEIVNETPAEIVETIEHSTEVSEQHSAKDWNMFSNINFEFSEVTAFPNRDVTGNSNLDSSGDEVVIVNTEQNHISVRRDVRVSGFANVQVCTIVVVEEPPPFQYKHTVRFSLPGYSGTEALRIWKQIDMPYPILSIEKDGILAFMEGEIKKKAVFNTNILVLDPAVSSCSTIRGAVRAWNLFRKTENKSHIVPYFEILNKYLLPIKIQSSD